MSIKIIIKSLLLSIYLILVNKKTDLTIIINKNKQFRTD